MRVRILYHDHCFDGAAAAAFFSRFYADKVNPEAEFSYTGMAHTADQIFSDSLFDGDENAIVDFKYATNPNLTWWFDHHQSAFLSASDAEHFQRVKNSHKFYFDPTFRSCTTFIAKVTREQYGYDPADLHELVGWADIIDGARYASAEEAVMMRAPAMKLTLVIEASKGSETVQDIIRAMQRKKLDEIVALPEIEAQFDPLYQRHLRSIEVIRKEASERKGVIWFDVTGYDLEGYNKFVPYYLFPDSTYTVSVSIQSFRTKVSVGSNPWAKEPPTVNLATICERYGGGGHPRVGAISFPKGDFESARRAGQEILRELRGE